VLAVGSQIVASRLRVPALIILLPAGFVAGALTDDIRGDLVLLVRSGGRPTPDDGTGASPPRPGDVAVVLGPVPEPPAHR
jgi:hypothetical protein